MNKASLLYWWPKIQDLRLNLPLTSIVPANRMEILEVMEGDGKLSAGFIARLFAAGDAFGYPLFLRTDLQSGKHGWKRTCFVPDKESLPSHVFAVCEENELGACFMGAGYEAIVFREFLDLEISFLAFYGDMPINKERRYFVRDGEVLCHHPYWPEESLQGHTQEKDWRGKLTALNAEDEAEISMLTNYAARVGKTLGGCWSVDFAKTKSGLWFLIDMALGEESYHWKGCKSANPSLVGSDSETRINNV